MVDTIKKHTVTKTINGRKYLFAGMSPTLAQAEKMAKTEPFVTKIFELVGTSSQYPFRIYARKPVWEYDERAGAMRLKK